MDEKITAKWARKQSEEVLGERVKGELSKCENAILAAVKSNATHCNVYIHAHNATLIELKRRGFKVEQHNEQRDGAILIISW